MNAANMAPMPATDTPPAAPGSSSSGKGPGRLWQIDTLRGLMLVLMTLTHLPTRFSDPAGQPFGYVSAAEGFVLLSAFMAGWVYTRTHETGGAPKVRSAFLKRVLKIYLSQAALLVFLFSAVAVIGLLTQQSAVTNLVSFYLGRPVEAVGGALLLVYNPPLLDILPMYIVFMLASSLVLVHGLQRGWRGLMLASVCLWIGAQFGLGRALYAEVVVVTGLDIPLAETGSFEILAWQMLWMVGLWLGAGFATTGQPKRFPRSVVVVAAVIATIGFVWRHIVGQAAFPGHDTLNLLFDKWRLGPLRLLDLFSLLVLAVRFAPWLERHLPRIRPLEVLGRASLPVFCTHLVIALLALAVLGEPTSGRPVGIDIALLVTTFAVLYAVALVSGKIDAQAARVRAAYNEARAARAARLSSSGSRSPTSRWHNPRR